MITKAKLKSGLARKEVKIDSERVLPTQCGIVEILQIFVKCQEM